MTATPAAAPAPAAEDSQTLSLSELLERPLTARDGESLGRLSDVIVRLRGAGYPLVTGAGRHGRRADRSTFPSSRSAPSTATSSS